MGTGSLWRRTARPVDSVEGCEGSSQRLASRFRVGRRSFRMFDTYVSLSAIRNSFRLYELWWAWCAVVSTSRTLDNPGFLRSQVLILIGSSNYRHINFLFRI